MTGDIWSADSGHEGLPLDGREVSREKYSKLFQVIGECYGKGDGKTTFNLPDFRGRNMGGFLREYVIEG